MIRKGDYNDLTKSLHNVKKQRKQKKGNLSKKKKKKKKATFQKKRFCFDHKGYQKETDQ